MLQCTVLSLFAPVALTGASMPRFELKNTAQPGMTIPALGLGTGGYGSKDVGYNGYPECWLCPNYTEQAVGMWIEEGGRYLDLALSYFNLDQVGWAIHKSSVPREDLFVLQKVGPSYPLGYHDMIEQVDKSLKYMNLTYFDAVLIHWPYEQPSQGDVSQWVGKTSDPLCNTSNNETFDFMECQLVSWKALLKIFDDGKAKAVGVSNWRIYELEAIRQRGLRMPSINQMPFNLYHHNADVREYCEQHGIHFDGFQPFGAPDWKLSFPHKPLMLEHPVVNSIAKKYGRKPSQVLIQWYTTVGSTHPRSMNRSHMIENLNSFDFKLTADELLSLESIDEDTCKEDPHYYLCVCPTDVECYNSTKTNGTAPPSVEFAVV